MERSDTSFVSAATASDSVDFDAHNMWNPLLEIPFHVQIGGIFEIFVEEIDLVRIALSCQFALDLLCDKAGTHDSAKRPIWHHCTWWESTPLPPLLCVLLGPSKWPIPLWMLSSHRTNYAGRCQSGTVPCIRLPSTQDLEEMVPDGA